MALDYYKILNITREATTEDVKKMYRELALKYHPDKNTSPTASKIFREVAEAYLVLSDHKKRAEYDTNSASKANNPSAFVDNLFANELFQNVIAGHSDLVDDLLEIRMNVGKIKRRRQSDQSRSKPFERILVQDPPVYHDLHVSLEELYTGCVKKMMITKSVFNTDSKTRRKEEKILTIDIEAGTKEKTVIVFPQEGDKKVDTIPADVIFVVKDRPHPLYHRDENNNVICKMQINLRQALLGDEFLIPTLKSKNPIHFELRDRVIKPAFTKTFQNLGLPIPKQNGVCGNMILCFDIVFPEKLSASQKHFLREILAPVGDKQCLEPISK